jgi:hypothetical protein
MHKTVSRLSFETLEGKTNFMMEVLELNHDKDCCLELINDGGPELEIHLFGLPDEIIIKKIEKLYGRQLIFNQCNVH